VDVPARLFDLRSQPLPLSKLAPTGQAVVLANLLRPLLLQLAGSIQQQPPPPDHLIASGLLRAEADEVARVYDERLGLRLRERRELGEWAALWLTRG